MRPAELSADAGARARQRPARRRPVARRRDLVYRVAELDLDRVEVVLVHDIEQLPQRLRLLGIALVHYGPLHREARTRTLPLARAEPARSLRDLEIAQHDLARGELVVADDQRLASAIAICDLQWANSLRRIVDVGRRVRRRRSSPTTGASDQRAPRAQRDRLEAAPRRLSAASAGATIIKKRSIRVRSRPPASAVRRATHQPVVAAAAAHRALRAERGRGDLENGAACSNRGRARSWIDFVGMPSSSR